MALKQIRSSFALPTDIVVELAAVVDQDVVPDIADLTLASTEGRSWRALMCTETGHTVVVVAVAVVSAAGGDTPAIESFGSSLAVQDR